MKQQKSIIVGIIEEQPLYREELRSIIKKITDYKLLLATNTVKNFLKKLQKQKSTHLIITGNDTTRTENIESILTLKRNFESTNIIYLISNTDILTKMLLFKHGINYQVEKSSTTTQLLFAIDDIMQHPSFVPGNFSNKKKEVKLLKKLTKRELLFVKYACSDLSYENIAHKMRIKRSTLDDYCKNTFRKLGVNSRQGLFLKMVREKIIYI